MDQNTALIFGKICAIIKLTNFNKEGGKNIQKEAAILNNVQVGFSREGVKKIHTFPEARIREDGKIEEIGPNGIITLWPNATFEGIELLSDFAEISAVSQPFG